MNKRYNTYKGKSVIEQNIKNNSSYCSVIFFNNMTVAVTA